MTPQELYDAFRSDIVDEQKPNLWSDDEVYRYMDLAHKQFVRLTKGIGDFTSDATLVDVAAGEPVALLHPSILIIRDVTLVSTGRKLKLINIEDGPNLVYEDYGQLRQLMVDARPGPLSHMVIGMEKNKARWVKVPEKDDAVYLVIYRLPLNTLSPENADNFVFEIEELHHRYLIDYMKALAYRKNDAETFDRGKAQESEATFNAYCAQALTEWERYKHKPRTVQYQGV